MFSYELCKRLKEAGFPLIELENYRNGEVDKVEPQRLWGGDETLKYKGKYYQRPFLEELVDECAKEVLGRNRNRKKGKEIGNKVKHLFRFGWSGKEWFATYEFYDSCLVNPFTELPIEGWGETSEEAVAELWLALEIISEYLLKLGKE